MLMQLAIYDDVFGKMLADWSTRTVSCHVTTGVHGYETCNAELRVPFYEAFLYYQQLGPLVLRVVWGGYKLWEGRLEDPTQFTRTVSGLKITAFGAWVALNDTTYVALWSLSDISGYRQIVNGELAAAFPDRFSFNTSNQLYIAPQKNATHGNTTIGKFGMLGYQLPDDSTKDAIGISFDYTLLAPAANWRGLCQTYDDTLGFIATIWVLTSAGAATLTGTINVTFAAARWLIFGLGFSATDAVFAGETGSAYLKITNVRIVTATTNRINTTLGTIIAAGTRTVTPASMARIYVGQRLQISQGSATVGESVVVTVITATTFTAVFAFAHVAADTVNAHVIYPDEVIKDLVTTVDTLNPSQMNSDTSAIQSQGIDLDQLVIEDQTPTSVINQMLAKSDTQARLWVGLVYNDQKLIVRPRGSGTAWFTDVASLEVVRTLTNLYNSVYAVYNDVAGKRKLRTAVSADTASVARFGLTRRTSSAVNSTDVTQAGKVRDTLLATSLDPTPRTSITLDRIFDDQGNPYPLYFVRTDDTLTIRNLPPILGQTYDKIRTLVITHTDYDIVKGSLTLELEIPLPDQSILLARALTS